MPKERTGLNFPKSNTVNTSASKLEGSWEVGALNPPTSVEVRLWTKKRGVGWRAETKHIALTANVWYTSDRYKSIQHERLIRKTARNRARLFLKPVVNATPNCIGRKIRLIIIYLSTADNFDMDNKGYFWGKIYQDMLVETGRIEDDRVKYIKSVHYIYKKGKEKIIFRIEEVADG